MRKYIVLALFLAACAPEGKIQNAKIETKPEPVAVDIKQEDHSSSQIPKVEDDEESEPEEDLNTQLKSCNRNLSDAKVEMDWMNSTIESLSEQRSELVNQIDLLRMEIQALRVQLSTRQSQ